MKDQLDFDVTDAGTIADSDSVGAWLRAGTDGDQISSGDGDSDNVANTFEGIDTRAFGFAYDAGGDNWDRIQISGGRLLVDAELDAEFDYVYDEDSTHTTGDPGSFGLSIRMADVDGANSAILAGTEGDYQGFFTNNKGELHVRDNDSVDLLTTIDADTSVIAGDTTSMDATLTALSKAEDATHGSGDQGIMALAVRSDADTAFAADGDYIPFSMNSSGHLRVNLASGTLTTNDAALANTAVANTATIVGVAATDLVGTDLTSRKYVFISNQGNKKIYVGGSGVTTAAGFPVSPGSVLELRAGASIDLHAIKAAGGSANDTRILELS